MLLPWETKRTPTLHAHSGMPSEEFIANLRAYAITSGLSVQVVDHIGRLTSYEDAEETLAAELTKTEDEDIRSGRESMKQEILADVNRWLENQPNYDLIAAPCEALIAEIEKVET